MRRKKAVPFAVAIVLVVVYIVNFLIPQPVITTTAVVTRVVDGDTIVVEGGDSVRLLDIDTPERGESCATNATNRLKQLIDGEEVTLVSGAEDKDQYGRLLRYVFLNDTLINMVLVREGFANLYVFNRDPRYYDALVEAEQKAKQENLCVWGVK